MVKLFKGRNDYVIMAHRDGLASLARLGVSDQVVALPQPIIVNKVYLMISRRSPAAALLPEIDQMIKTIKQNGRLEAIIAKYVAIDAISPLQDFVVPVEAQ